MSIVDDLAKVYEQTGHAHHEAFAAVDGVDPDWAIWYAGYLKPRFDDALDVQLSRSEIVALVQSLQQEHEARAADQPWPRFYATQTAERFVGADQETYALYHSASCPYCVMVRRTIDELGVSVELRDLAQEPKWREELLAARGRGTVPVLRCESPDGAVRWMPESRDIIRYLRKRSG